MLGTLFRSLNWAFHTEPQPGLNDRRGYQPRGKDAGRQQLNQRHDLHARPPRGLCPSGQVAALDNNGIVRSINPALEQLLGVQANLALGRPLHELNPAIDVADALRSGIGEEKQGDSAGRPLGDL